MYVHVCSARLAAATGTADHPGLKEEAKKDVITGRKPLQFHVTRHYISFLLLIFSQLFVFKKKNTTALSQIVLTRKEMPSRKNTKDMVAKRRKRRKRKMKNRKRNPHLGPHPTAVLLQVLSLKVMEKELVMASILLQHHLAHKNQCPNSFQKANEEKRKEFPLSRRSLNC